MLPPKNRLKKKTDFEQVFKKGKGWREGPLFLKIKNNNLGITRFGFAVGKNVSKKATVRNKIKRKLRELARMSLPQIKEGTDGVLIASSGLENKKFGEVKEVFDKLLKKAGMFKI